MKFLLYLMMVLGIGIYWLSQAQHIAAPNLDPPGFCAQDHLHEQRLLTDTAYAHRHAAMEEQILASHRQGASARMTEDYTLPVVFHIIHNGGSENISDDQIQAALVNLNEAFANVGYYDPTTGVDVQIDFCLAIYAPDSSLTTGINRVQSSLTTFNSETEDLDLKNLSRWNPRNYINIWVVQDICDNAGCAVAGYAYSPGAHGEPYDGIVVESELGSSPENSTYLVHEMGHYLGLYHTFRNGCENDNCLSDGDRVCDTPPDNTTTKPPCDEPSNSCSTDEDDASLNNPFRAVALGGLGDQPDLIENYMDYSRKECYNQFTQGQKDRMQEVVAGTRSSLLQSFGCIGPCLFPVEAGFVVDEDTIYAGETLHFSNTSVNAEGFQWYVNEELFSTDSDANFTFNEPGTFALTLEASSGFDNCFLDDYSINITVLCQAKAVIASGNAIVAPGDSLLYTHESLFADQVSWTLNGEEFSTQDSVGILTTEEGSLQLCLEVTNAFCQDRKCIKILVMTLDSIDPQEICDNGLDEDGDGLIDCEDSDCPCAEDCVGTFVRIFERDALIPAGLQLIPTDDEHFLIRTNYVERFSLGNDRRSLTQINQKGDILWHRTFDEVEGRISEANWRLDTGGAIIGQFDNKNFFKYDAVNDSILWAMTANGPPYSHIFSDIDVSANTNTFLLCGKRSPSSPALLKVHKNTGEVIWQKAYEIPDVFVEEQAFDGLLQANGLIYTIGTLSGFQDGQSSMDRSSLSVLDQDGAMLFSNFYRSHFNENIHYRAHSLKLLSDGLLQVLYTESATDDPSSDSGFMIMKTDFGGHPLWSKRVTLPDVGNFQLIATEVPDGFLLYGNTNEIYENGKIYLARLDQEGNLLWANTYGDLTSQSVNWLTKGSISQVGNYIYYLFGVENQVHFYRINLDGSMDQNNCEAVAPLELNVDDVTDVFVQSVNFQEAMPTAYTFSPIPAESSSQNLVYQQDCAPSLCDTLCLYDFTIQIDTAICNGDSLSIDLELCNISNESFEGALSLALYDQNPLLEDADFLHRIELPNVNLDGLLCEHFQVNIPYLPVADIFAMVNDNGHYLTPFDPQTVFPVTNVNECDFTNNLTTFSFEFAGYDLYLGPDVTICENDSLLLDAGPGFEQYLWNNGDTSQAITVVNARAYSVSVTNRCGEVYQDTIQVAVDKNVKLEVDSMWVCSGETALIIIPEEEGYSYEWSTDGIIICDCSVFIIYPTFPRLYQVVATTENGCSSADSVVISPLELPTLEMTDNLVGCTPKSGFLFVEIVEGTGPFEVHWSDGQTGFTATQLGPGTYTVTVTDGNGCQSMDTASVIVEQAEISAAVYPEDISCFGESDGVIRVEAVGGGTAPYSYSLDGIDYQIDSTFTDLGPGEYTVWIRDAEDCTVSYSIEVEEPILLQLDIPERLNIALGDSLQLEAQVSKPVAAYHWEPSAGLSCTDCPNPTVFPLLDTDYVLTVEDQDGCIASTSTRVLVQQKRRIFIPNAFSPNGDGINDQLRIFCGPEVEEVESFRIYSRWGEMVHEAIHIQPNTEYGPWDGYLDGRVMKPAVFVYRAIVRYIDGTEEVIDGNVALLR